MISIILWTVRRFQKIEVSFIIHIRPHNWSHQRDSTALLIIYQIQRAKLQLIVISQNTIAI